MSTIFTTEALAKTEKIEVPIHVEFRDSETGGRIKATAPRTQITRDYNDDAMVEMNYREAGWACLAAFMAKLGVDLSESDVTLEGSYVRHLKADYRYTVRY